MAVRRTLRSAAPAGRGFTIVEFMIVLVVVGLLMGAALVPLATRNEEKEFAAERENIEALRAAVIGFATNNRTHARTVVIDSQSPASAGTSPTAASEAVIPAGRPFLPCPDIDGDGYEDRLLPGPAPLTVTMTADENYRELYAAGGCTSNMGLLPWRSIGVEATDTWGNLYAYRVHDSFANRITGFDHLTRADAYDESSLLEQQTFTLAYTAPLTVSTDPTQYVMSAPITGAQAAVVLTVYNRLDLATAQGAVNVLTPATMEVTVGVPPVAVSMTLNRYPLIVCSPMDSSPTVNIDPLCLDDGVAGDLVRWRTLLARALPAVELDAPREGPSGPLVARVYGHPVTVDIQTDPSKIITDGAAFGIVSFGRNGNGAIKLREWGDGGSTIDCSDRYRDGSVFANVFHPEGVHALWLMDVVMPAAVRTKCAFTDAEPQLVHYARRMMFWMPRTGRRPYRFVFPTNLNSANSGAGEYDDVTGWVAPNELVGKLARQKVFPVPAMPYLGLSNTFGGSAPRGGFPTLVDATPSGVQINTVTPPPPVVIP